MDNQFLHTCAKIARIGNAILDKAITISLAIVLVFGCYSLYDTYAIFKGAGVSSGLLKYKPELNYDIEVNPTIEELVAMYPDARMWLTIEDTKIDAPVVQSTDNIKYVNYNIDGEFALSGEIFLDCRSAGDLSDDYSILYGHHMEMQAMFGGLDAFASESYMEEHNKAYMFLPNTTKEAEIFAFVSADAYDMNIFDTIEDNVAEQAELLAYIQEKATVYREEVDLDSCEQIVAFSTCSVEGTDARTIVFAAF